MTGAIILAAGASTRLGQPKQQLLYKGKTLLQNAVDAALQANCKPIIVVLGFEADAIGENLKERNISIVINNNWQQGMASSIVAGMKEINKIDVNVQNVVVMVSDQPFADASLLSQLISKKNTCNKNIVASSYSGTIGVPAVFDKALFAELLSLKGEEGAKKILLKKEHSITTIDFPLGKIDIDTLEDFNSLPL